MYRSGWLAAGVVLLASAAGLAQDETTRRGFRTLGAFGGEEPGQVQRSTEVELEGGQRVSGEITLKPLTIDSDAGRYAIDPDKIKMIRFLKPPAEPEAGVAEEASPRPTPPPGPAEARRRAAMVMGRGFVPDPITNVATTMARGKVSTTTGKDIIGNIYLPADLKIALDVGTLYLSADKLRNITFTDAAAEPARANEPARPPASPAPSPAPASQPAAAGAERSPTYFREGNRLFIFRPGGNRVAMYDLDTRKSQAIELGASKDAPIEVMPIVGPPLLALHLKGPKITRIAVADLTSGTWHTQDLRQPVEGVASPIVGQGVVVYALGRHAYAYSVSTDRWDVVELPEGTRSAPSFEIDGVTIQGSGHLYTFSASTGKWDHIDLGAILDTAGTEKK